MNLKIKQTIEFLLQSVLLMNLLACAAREIPFKQEIVAKPLPTAPPFKNPEGEQSVTEKWTITAETSTIPVDMVWIIDNSGSMNEEAEHVRKNLEGFLSYLNDKSNFRFLLISAEGTKGTRVTLPKGLDPMKFRQENRMIGSWDAPSQLVEVLKLDTYSTFFREESLKTIIFVTDDDSELPAEDFKAEMQQLGSQWTDKLKIHSFIGLNDVESSCMAREGLVYKDLASSTEGLIFNICDADWSPSFKNIIDNTINTIKRAMTLKNPMKKLVQVKVNGVSMDLLKIEIIDPMTISFSGTVDLKAGDQVMIEYLKK